MHSHHGSHRDRGGRWVLGKRVWWVGLEDGGDDEQADRHQSQTDTEGHSSTESVDTKGDKDSGSDNLDDTVDTRGEQGSVLASDTNSLEDGWGVVVDGALRPVSTRHLGCAITYF